MVYAEDVMEVLGRATDWVGPTVPDVSPNLEKLHSGVTGKELKIGPNTVIYKNLKNSFHKNYYVHLCNWPLG